jgi:DNA-binding NtrC family response regulator
VRARVCREIILTPLQPTTLIDGSRLVGHSLLITSVRKQIAQIAGTDANVLITGESGTGKDVAATLIHRNSRASDRPLVAVNCAAVPDSLLESELFGHERGAFTGATATRQGKLQHASGGTLFLDEVGDMPLLAQAKILRAIEAKVIQRLGSNIDIPLSIRLIAATNQDLEILVQEKKFRQDLYFRLNVIRLHLPSLRERSEDIPELSEHILQEFSEQQRRPPCRIDRDLMKCLQTHDWPGNVRELRNVIECLLVYSSSHCVGISDLPEHVRRTLRSGHDDQRSRIVGALNSTDWNRSKAAEILQCSRMTLYRKMVKFSVQRQSE